MPNCLDAHTDPAQYPWLSDINGGIDHIEFEEPAGSGNWQPYTMQTWQIHCDQNIIDHDPSNLVESHMSSFVNPSTRFAKLLYYFIDGTFREPLQTDYVREANWFAMASWNEGDQSTPPPAPQYKEGGKIKRRMKAGGSNMKKLRNVSSRNQGGILRKKNKGGLLKGASHARGGIPARLSDGRQIELEGGEYIVNAQTVKAVGEQFLNELNSTATTHHKGGYSRGQLPNPSNYKLGGKIMPRRIKRKRMSRGGRTRQMQVGGGTCPPGQVMQRGQCVPMGTAYRAGVDPVGRATGAPLPTQYGGVGPGMGATGAPLPTAKRGGRARKMQLGGSVNIGDCIKWGKNGECIDKMY